MKTIPELRDEIYELNRQMLYTHGEQKEVLQGNCTFLEGKVDALNELYYEIVEHSKTVNIKPNYFRALTWVLEQIEGEDEDDPRQPN